MVRPATKPRNRRDSGTIWLSTGYRSFFLLACLWALVVLPLTVAAIRGSVVLPVAVDPVRWHFHEMMFGYVVAALAGFLLTAVPNWTGRLPLQVPPLLGIIGLWGAGRLAMIASGAIGLAAAVDLLFLATLLAATARVAATLASALYDPLIYLAAAWMAAFALFLLVCAPKLQAGHAGG